MFFLPLQMKWIDIEVNRKTDDYNITLFFFGSITIIMMIIGNIFYIWKWIETKKRRKLNPFLKFETKWKKKRKNLFIILEANSICIRFEIYFIAMNFIASFCLFWFFPDLKSVKKWIYFSLFVFVSKKLFVFSQEKRWCCFSFFTSLFNVVKNYYHHHREQQQQQNTNFSSWFEKKVQKDNNHYDDDNNDDNSNEYHHHHDNTKRSGRRIFLPIQYSFIMIMIIIMMMVVPENDFRSFSLFLDKKNILSSKWMNWMENEKMINGWIIFFKFFATEWMNEWGIWK